MNISSASTYTPRSQPTPSACMTDSSICGDAGRYPWCPVGVLETAPVGESGTRYGKRHANRCEGTRPEEGRA